MYQTRLPRWPAFISNEEWARILGGTHLVAVDADAEKPVVTSTPETRARDVISDLLGKRPPSPKTIDDLGDAVKRAKANGAVRGITGR